MIPKARTTAGFRVALSVAIACGSLSCDRGGGFYVEVASDTSWSGYFGNRTVDGTGRKAIELGADSPACVTAQKTTEAGYLTITIFKRGRPGSPRSCEPVTTRAAFGVVESCCK